MTEAPPTSRPRAPAALLALRWLVVLGTVAAAADWLAFRSALLPPHPVVFASLLAVVMALTLALLAWGLARFARGRRGIARIAGGLALAGLLGLETGGMLNWLLSLQGAVVLNEGEAVPLSGTGHLQAFEAGPLADLGELRLVIELVEVELRPGESGGFYPESRLKVQEHTAAPVQVTVSPRASATFGPLRLHQGAFGFAPRLVVTKGDATAFDRVVPIMSRRDGETGVAFEQELTIAKEQLAIRGVVSLEGLNIHMLGHPRLLLEVTRRGRPLGRGELSPGRFADLAEGYRIGFAGLQYWAEIDLSRRTYPEPIYAGAALLGLGALFGLGLGVRWLLDRQRGASA